MCRFSHQISFTSSAWHSLLSEPVDPFSPVRAPIESLGGKLLSAFFTDDNYDVLALSEFPDAVSPNDISIAFYSAGAVAIIHSSPLLTASQAQQSKHRLAASTRRVIPSSSARAASAS
jgi:uncharacterized protein with GYD domain